MNLLFNHDSKLISRCMLYVEVKLSWVEREKTRRGEELLLSLCVSLEFVEKNSLNVVILTRF